MSSIEFGGLPIIFTERWNHWIRRHRLGRPIWKTPPKGGEFVREMGTPSAISGKSIGGWNIMNHLARSLYSWIYFGWLFTFVCHDKSPLNSLNLAFGNTSRCSNHLKQDLSIGLFRRDHLIGPVLSGSLDYQITGPYRTAENYVSVTA